MGNQIFFIVLLWFPVLHIVKHGIEIGEISTKWAMIANSDANVFALFQFLGKNLFRVIEEIPTAFIDFFIKAATAKDSAAPLNVDFLPFFYGNNQFCFSAF